MATIKDLEKEHTNLKEQLKQLQGAKNKLATQMDHLSVSLITKVEK